MVQVKSPGTDLRIQSWLVSKADGFGQSPELWLEAKPCTHLGASSKSHRLVGSAPQVPGGDSDVTSRLQLLK